MLFVVGRTALTEFERRRDPFRSSARTNTAIGRRESRFPCERGRRTIKKAGREACLKKSLKSGSRRSCFQDRAAKTRGHGGNHDVKLRSGEVEPERFTVADVRQAQPFDDGGLIATDFKSHGRGRAIEEVNATRIAPAFDVEAADAVAGNAVEIIVAAFERKADHFDQLFVAADEMFAQAKQTQAMFAKGFDSNGHRLPVWPKNLVPFEFDLFSLAIPAGITTKENGKRAGHPGPLSN
ncbi:MAG: hypothetical protein WCL32_19965 [Planctomycetota bacterium]